jgi:hypothetical protein
MLCINLLTDLFPKISRKILGIPIKLVREQFLDSRPGRSSDKLYSASWNLKERMLVGRSDL